MDGRGADLIFLSELPIGIIPERNGAPPKSATFTLKAKPGKRLEKRWTLDAGEHGLPTLTDMGLFICLMAYTRLLGFPTIVPFSRSWIVRDLGWPVNQQSYDRVKLGLDRLLRTTYTAINHYPDPQGRACRSQTAFHLLQGYEIHDSRFADAQLPPSWIVWGDHVLRLLQTPQMKELDFAFFRSLKNPLAKAAYRYLHTRQMDGKAIFQENLVEYACERLGLSRHFRWASDLKRTLDPVHAELIERGFIASATYERLKGEKGERAGQKVVIRFPEGVGRWALGVGNQLLTPDAQRPTPNAQRLVDRLVAAGLTVAIAARLAAQYPEAVARQLDFWPYRAPRAFANPAGALRRAIEEDWAAPTGWKPAAVAALQGSGVRGEGSEGRAFLTPDPSPLTPDPCREAAAAFDAWWAQLPEPERERLTQAARAELIGGSALIARHYERHPDRLFEALRPLLARQAVSKV